MAYVKLNDRIAELPLILAGPILRKVTATSVTVWLALKQTTSVTLTIFDGETELFSGTATPAPIGAYLYLVSVAATASGGQNLVRGKIYGYSLTFDAEDLAAPGVYSTGGGLTPLCYATHPRPTFVIAPPSWRDLHFIHGSCRKIHAQGLDALPAASNIIAQAATNPAERAQFLLLTGDQIYADDVASSVLFMLRDVGATLLGRADTLPGIAAAISLEPGHRASVARDTLLLSSEEESCTSHLFHFYEFCAMYLFAWSDVLWPKAADLPTYKDVYGTAGTAGDLSQYGFQLGHVQDFLSTLPEVRRVLANVPCYMIFDDHEVTDDWYISADWCARVLGNDAGRKVIQNALCAYAIFQAWGNTPEQFDAASAPGAVDKPGRMLLKELAKGAGASSGVLDWLLNIPPKRQIFYPDIFSNPNPTRTTDLTEAMKNAPSVVTLRQQVAQENVTPDWLIWHYVMNGTDYQLIVLDTRTLRGYPGPNGFYPPLLLSDAAWNAEVVIGAAPPAGTNPEITIVLSPAAPLAAPVVEYWQEGRSESNVLEKDVEGWTGQNRGFQLLLSKFATRPFGAQTTPPIRRRVVILSGDVHYAFAVRVQYWATKPYQAGTTEAQAVFALLTSSSFKNQHEGLKDTIGLHDHGYEMIGGTANNRNWINYFGWENAAKADTKVATLRNLSGPYSSSLKLRKETPVTFCIERQWESEFGGTKNGSATLTTGNSPEWRYNVRYLDSRLALPVITTSTNTKGKDSVATAHKQHQQYVRTAGPGFQIVGRNNLGEITFKFPDDNTQKVRIGQRLWWREPQAADARGLTFHIVSLDFAGPDPAADDDDFIDPLTKLGT